MKPEYAKQKSRQDDRCFPKLLALSSHLRWSEEFFCFPHPRGERLQGYDQFSNGGFPLRNSFTLIPVSYTHLDVYKRQVMRWWKCFRAASGSLLSWLAGELARRVEPATWLGGGFESPRAMGRKIFSLFGLYRSTYHPKFIHSDFNLLCLVNPLVFLRN